MTPTPKSSALAAPRRWLIALLGTAVIGAGMLFPMAFSHPANAPISGQEPAPTPFEGPEMGGTLFRLIGGTALVLSLGVAALFACRRFLGLQPGPTEPGAGLAIVETLPLGGLCRVHLVQAGERFLLAGTDASGLKLLLPVDVSEETSAQLETTSESQARAA